MSHLAFFTPTPLFEVILEVANFKVMELRRDEVRRMASYLP